MTTFFDVIIVGAGPAGCACALSLNKSGHQVALIDKAVFPRDKICGDAIPGPAFKAIGFINPHWGASLKEFSRQTVINSSAFYLPFNKKISYHWKLYASNSKRIDFDDFLFSMVNKETNTTVYQNSQVVAVRVTQDGVTCTLKDGRVLNASLIIGADGSNSIVKRSLLKLPGKRQEVYAAVRAYYSGISGNVAGQNEFHYLKDVDGYFWIFPLPNNFFNVGFGILNKKNKKNRETRDTRKTLDQIIQADPFKERFEQAKLVDKINGHGLPIWTNSHGLSGERFLLAGDAASLIDPLQGHGIDKAIRSGIYAANQVKKCFAADRFDADFMRNYEKEVAKKLGRELRRSYLMMRILLKHPFLIKFLALLNPSQKIINWVIRKIKL